MKQQNSSSSTGASMEGNATHQISGHMLSKNLLTSVAGTSLPDSTQRLLRNEDILGDLENFQDLSDWCKTPEPTLDMDTSTNSDMTLAELTNQEPELTEFSNSNQSLHDDNLDPWGSPYPLNVESQKSVLDDLYDEIQDENKMPVNISESLPGVNNTGNIETGNDIYSQLNEFNTMIDFNKLSEEMITSDVNSSSVEYNNENIGENVPQMKQEADDIKKQSFNVAEVIEMPATEGSRPTVILVLTVPENGIMPTVNLPVTIPDVKPQVSNVNEVKVPSGSPKGLATIPTVTAGSTLCNRTSRKMEEKPLGEARRKLSQGNLKLNLNKKAATCVVPDTPEVIRQLTDVDERYDLLSFICNDKQDASQLWLDTENEINSRVESEPLSAQNVQLARPVEVETCNNAVGVSPVQAMQVVEPVHVEECNSALQSGILPVTIPGTQPVHVDNTILPIIEIYSEASTSYDAQSPCMSTQSESDSLIIPVTKTETLQDSIPSTKRRRTHKRKQDADEAESPPKKRSSPVVTVKEDTDEEYYSDSRKYRLQRDRNNEASRKSRQNRKQRDVEMNNRVEELEMDNARLRAREQQLDNLVKTLRDMLLQQVLQAKK